VDTGLEDVDALFAELATLGIHLDAVTDTLLAEGLASFQKSFDTLIAGIEQKTAALGLAGATK
jgi:hypothetical protein